MRLVLFEAVAVHPTGLILADMGEIGFICGGLGPPTGLILGGIGRIGLLYL